MKGRIGHAAFYDQALSSTRIAAHVGAAFNLSTTQLAGLTSYLVNQGTFLTWTLLGGATSYDYRIDGGVPTNVSTNKAILSGLTNGQTYNVEVRGVNSSSTTPWRSISVTPSAAYMFDTFDRAAAGPSTTALGTSTDGHSWGTAVSGGWGIDASGYAYPMTANTENWQTFAAGFDIDISFQFAPGLAQASMDGGVLFRYRDASNTFMINVNSSLFALYRRSQSTTWNQMATLPIAYFPVPAGALVRVIAVGTSIQVWVNGIRELVMEDVWSVGTDTIAGIRGYIAASRIDWVHARAASALPVPGGTLQAIGGSTTPSATPQLVTSHVYKGRDTKNQDTVGAS